MAQIPSGESNGGVDEKWRSGRDSNPRCGFAAYSLSRRAPSTTRPPLRMLWNWGHVERHGLRGKLAAPGFPPIWRQAMARRFDHPPTAEEIEAIARDAMRRLPEPFAGHLAHVVLQIDEYADDALLAEMGIDHPLDLTGVYEGIPIGLRSVETSGTLPDRIRLVRQPIL